MADQAKLHYNASLTGLRGFLALLVLFFHTGVPLIPGGARGVDMFFVLSGFLITSLLKVEVERNGVIDYFAFWRRRLKRLMPPLILFTTVYIIFAGVILPNDVASLRYRDAVTALTYSYNWDLIYKPRLTGMGHLWSLAVEGQFYLFWPIAVGWIHSLGRRAAPVLFTIFLALTAYRVIGMCVANNIDVVIYSTFGHSSGLALGSLLAFLPNRPQNLGYLGIAGTLAFILLPDRHDVFWGQIWTISVAELSAAALICGLIGKAQGFWLIRPLSTTLMVGLGEISYEIYLWHFPFRRFSAGGWIVSTLVTLLCALFCAWLSRELFRSRKTSSTGRGRPSADCVSDRLNVSKSLIT